MRVARLSFFIFVFFFLAACAGRQFDRPSEELLQLGKTTEKQVVTAMGNPDKTSWKERNQKKTKELAYTSLGPGGTRLAWFEFFDGVLISWQYFSTFPGELKDYSDMPKAGNIVEDKSSRNDVEAVFGKPNGEGIYPYIKDPERRLLTYQIVSDKYADSPSGYKEIYYEIDKGGIVRKIKEANLKLN